MGVCVLHLEILLAYRQTGSDLALQLALPETITIVGLF